MSPRRVVLLAPLFELPVAIVAIQQFQILEEGVWIARGIPRLQMTSC
jgi:hypothetical protein